MKATIVIITHNNEKEVGDAIYSVKNQTYNNWECLVVDNGSTDSTRDRISAYIQADKRFRMYRKENRGPSAGRNYGFRMADSDSEYIHFLDGDDMIRPEFLTKMIAYMDQHPQVGLLGCQYNEVDKHGTLIRKGHRSRFREGHLGFPHQIRSSENYTPFVTFFSATGQGAFALFRCSVFGQTSGYEESFWAHEDSDIFCQMSLLSEVHYLPDRLYDVRIRSHSLSRAGHKETSSFRDKWDLYFSDRPDRNHTIEKALKYYYNRHKPMRDFKVGVKAFKNFILTAEVHQLRWSFQCFGAGLADFFLHRSLKARMELRRKSQLQIK